MILKNLFNKFRKPKQTCFVYCPKCRNELTSSTSFVEDKDGIVKYKCYKCGNISFWDFIHYPVPYLRTCAKDCRHCQFDKIGKAYCDKVCNPDSMVKFEPHGCGCNFCDDIYDIDSNNIPDGTHILYDKDLDLFHIYAQAGDPYDSGWAEDIKFCPYCGKELKGEKNEEKA